MPSEIFWRGDAPAIAQQMAYDITGAAIGKRFRFYIPNNTRPGPSYTTTSAVKAAIAAGLVTAINDAAETYKEFSQVSAEVNPNQEGIIVTSTKAGRPFSITGTVETPASVDIATTTEGSPEVNEKQTITLPSDTDGGTFKIGYDNGSVVEYTSNLAYNISTVSLKAAIEGLSGWDVVNVSGAFPTFVVEFVGTYAGSDVDPMLLDTSGLTAGGGSTSGSSGVAVTQEAAAAVDEVQTITLTNATGGTFTLRFGDETTAAIAYNAAAAAVESALEALTGIDDVAVTGTAPTWTVTFGGAEAETDVSSLVGNADNLTGSSASNLSFTTLTASSGPNDAAIIYNWWNEASGQAQFPVAGDTVHFLGTSAVFWNLDKFTGVAIAITRRWGLHTGYIGLPDFSEDGFKEWRPIKLSWPALYFEQGRGQGPQSGRCRIDFEDAPACVKVYATGGPVGASFGERAFMIVNEEPASGEFNLQIYDGDVGMAALPGEVASFDRLQKTGGHFEAGSGCHARISYDDLGGSRFIDLMTSEANVPIRTAR
ncbi:MAG: hypothetical protein HC841_00325 [Verrucomicrobiae bacterium]|nr:hypothetical protein [Verrucomicrobiae bacterium]